MTRRAQAVQLATRLGERDHAILNSLQEFRLLSGSQVRRWHFPDGQQATASRKARAALKRLADLGLVVRLTRRVGGVRSGSEGYVFGLSGLGHAVLDIDQPVPQRHRRVPETKLAHQNHVLGVSELAVSLTEQARPGVFTVEELRAEPGCWRWFSGVSGERRTLKPDAFVSLGVGDFILSSFIELDMDNESLPTIARKCGVYVDYWRSGIEQRRHGVFPRVWWLVPHEDRQRGIRQVIARLPENVRGLFAVALTKDAVPQLIQLTDTEGGAL